MSTLKAFARDAARRYLQSAVFVDDEIFDKHSGMPVETADLPKSRKPIFRRTASKGTIQTAEQKKSDATAVEQPYHPKDLVSSFAQEGIICALYEPPKDFPTNPDSEIFKLCERTDIIILDWDFSGDRGKKALDLIAVLVKQSHQEFPHHTRLLSIYTADPSLVAVANQIGDRLRAEGFPALPEQSQCRLRSGATRLLVFGKDIPRIGADEEQFTLKEKQLANRLVEEFADMNSGILPSYALHAMAAVRHNSKRILDRFHGEMDAAFLLHRAMVIDNEEALEQLPELLSEELLAVIEEEHTTVAGIRKCFNKLASQFEIGPPKRPWCDKNGKPMDASDSLRNLLKSGVGGLTDKNQEIKQIANLAKKGWRGVDAQTIQDLQLMVDPNKTESNQRLASLFASRTQYNNKIRHLCYGTIVRHRESKGKNAPWVYSFCFMPICDSVRLQLTKQFKHGDPVSFPFWRLREDVYAGSTENRRGIVLELFDKTHVELSAGGKPRDMLWDASFNVNKTTGTVTASRKRDGGFTFVTNDKLRVAWVGQLKPLHSQRIAYDIGQSLSRVGLVEAEWLRLLCDR